VPHLQKVSKCNKLFKFESLRIYDLLYLFGNGTGVEPGYSAELIFARIFFLSKFTCMPNFTSLKKVQVMLWCSRCLLPYLSFWSKSAHAIQFTVHYTLSYVTNILFPWSLFLHPSPCVVQNEILSFSPLLKLIFTKKCDRLWMMLCFLEFFPVELKSNLNT